MTGLIEGIFIGLTKREPMRPVREASITETGIVGDRYAAGMGSFTKVNEAGDAGRHVTLIEAEAIATARDQFGVDWSAWQV